MNNWFREHRPAIFMFSIFAVGIILIIISNYSPNEDDFLLILKPILAGLGGTFTAGGIATLFLNLPKTRDYISKTVSNIFTSGDIVNSISIEHRSFLKKKIISNELNNTIDKIEDDLYQKINQIQYNCQSDFHLHNYMVDFSIADSRKYIGMVEEEQLISYQVVSNHLPQSHNKIYELALAYHSPIFDKDSLTTDDFIQSFQLSIGNQVYNKTDLKISERENGGMTNYMYDFRKKIKVHSSLNIEIKVKVVKPLIDQSFSLYVRHPTKVYSARLSYRDEYHYVCNWFRYWDKKRKLMDSILDGKEFTNGIAVMTREWLLPGEGVVLEFHMED